MRQDLTHILQWIEPGSRVLDLGCSDGQFLLQLQRERQVRGLGLEINPEGISAAIGAGLNVLEQNMDTGLDNFPDQSFDTVVMAQTLQALHYPHLVLDEMLRIGRTGIVTFPNFAHWRCRWYLGTRGRMPVSRSMPHSWYDTPNIHFCTVRDFETLCHNQGIKILHRHMVGQGPVGSKLAGVIPNLFAMTAIYHISR
jgi:methionine biosynthesis protein MetW